MKRGPGKKNGHTHQVRRLDLHLELRVCSCVAVGLVIL
jgi:hypothetical protein